MNISNTQNDKFIKLVLNRVFKNTHYNGNINIISNKVFNILNKDIINKYRSLLNNKLAYYIYFNDISYLNNTLNNNLNYLLNNKYDKLILNYYKNDNNNSLIKTYNTQSKLKTLYSDYIINEFMKKLNYKYSFNHNNIFKIELNISKYFEFKEIDIYLYINNKYYHDNNYIIYHTLINDIDNNIVNNINDPWDDFKHIKIITHNFKNYMEAILLNELFINNNNSIEDNLIKYFKLYKFNTPSPNNIIKNNLY